MFIQDFDELNFLNLVLQAENNIYISSFTKFKIE